MQNIENNNTTKKIYFRHNSFRKEQNEIITDIYSTINSKKSMLLHAPTGIGKTDAALSAAISYAKDKDIKILFLTPKISQHKIALEVIRGINNKYDLDIKAIEFVGKKKMCTDPVIRNVNSNFYEICSQATKKHQCSFYENIKPKDKSTKENMKFKINRLLENENILSHLEIKDIAENFKSNGLNKPLCAYELAKIYGKSCKIIIADYYHLFSTSVSGNFLTELGIDINNCIVIVDEAHNLEERVLKLQSRSLNTYIINRAIKECKELKNSVLKSILIEFLHKFEKLEEKYLKNKKEEFITKEDLFFPKLENNYHDIITNLEESGLEYVEKLNKHSSSLVNIALFLKEWNENLKAHIRFITNDKNTISIKYNALDVSLITKNIFENTHSNILMSATLTPLNMYQKILGLNESTLLKEYTSPFDKDKRLNLLVSNITTKFASRNIQEYKNIAQNIDECVKKIPGNTIIFFPSFGILNQVVDLVKSNKPKLIQQENQDPLDFEKMINEFKEHSLRFGSNLFAVMGGKASEGIDLPGNYLKAAIIIGIPLARMNLEIKSKIGYYQDKYNNGLLYAYIQPAIQKVIQSAGRVIRTESDKGTIIYMDKRYLWESYRRCLPKSEKIKLTKNLEKEISSFFEIK